MRAEPDLSRYYRPTDRPLPFVMGIGEGDANAGVRFVCGYLGCDARPFNPLLDALPDVPAANEIVPPSVINAGECAAATA